MKTKAVRLIVLVAGVLFLCRTASATEWEVFFGRYSHRGKELKIAFTLGPNGVTDVEFDSLKLDGVFEYSPHGIYGNTGFIEIELSRISGESKKLQLLIFEENGRVKAASGLYTHLVFPDPSKGDSVAKKVATIKLEYARSGSGIGEERSRPR